MVIGVCEIILHLPEAHSLKDKRQVIQSLMTRIRNQFQVAIAEVEEQDQWQIAHLGVSCVSNSGKHAEQIIAHIQRFIEETRPDIVVSRVESEIMNW
jgi:uncharacterized protein YlxP (DUF503 family)